MNLFIINDSFKQPKKQQENLNIKTGIITSFRLNSS